MAPAGSGRIGSSSVNNRTGCRSRGELGPADTLDITVSEESRSQGVDRPIPPGEGERTAVASTTLLKQPRVPWSLARTSTSLFGNLKGSPRDREHLGQ